MFGTVEGSRSIFNLYLIFDRNATSLTPMDPNDGDIGRMCKILLSSFGETHFTLVIIGF